jgi:predicted MPP superfamily phosphohydrolase
MLKLLFYWLLFALGFGAVIGVIYLIVLIVNKFANKRRTAPRPFVIIFVVMSLTWLGFMVHGHVVGRWNIAVRNFNFKMPSSVLPASFEGYKIVMFSDMHIDGWHSNPEKLQRVVDEINRVNADVVCFGGDMITNNFHELDSVSDILSGIVARDGLYAVTGNYDCQRYVRGLTDDERQTNVDSLLALLGNMGWRSLINDHVILRRGSDSIALAGVSSRPADHDSVSVRQYLTQALEGIDSTVFTMLLTHDPTMWRGNVCDSTNVTLTMSGHTPAWQLRVGSITPAEFLSTENAGWRHCGNQHIFVSVGLGSRMRFRIGAAPEIVVITLHSSEQ